MTSNQDDRKEQQPQVPLSELIKTRYRKAADFREKGINPYPYRYRRTHTVAEILDDFDRLSSEGTHLSLAGRIMLKRKMGKSIFADIHDVSGRIQVYLKIDEVGREAFKIFDKLDLGDIVGLEGKLFVTKTGEKTVMVERYEVLAKSLHPLPDKHSGLIDKDLRYRRRYADLIVNPEVREIFVKRSRIIKSIREFLDSRGFLEVETPILQPLYGGGAALPFITHHNRHNVDLYLRIADELYLKRLIIGGYEKVWEYCKDFRNEGLDRLHNPEFSMVELYWAYADYNDIMNLFQDMMRKIVLDLHGKYSFTFEDHEMDFEPDFKVVSMIDAIREACGVDLIDLDFETSLARAKDEGIETEGLMNWGKVVEAFFEEKVEPYLIQPTFVKDFPRDISPLAKVHRDNPRLSERFEAFIAGMEMGNAFSELNDPDEQRRRFEAQVEAARAGDEEAHRLDEDFITALMYGMPPTGGLGFGIDRLVMLLTNTHSIQEVIFFPQMRPSGEKEKIFGTPVEWLRAAAGTSNEKD
jgi:lysyl-tRNA synthetase class 2